MCKYSDFYSKTYTQTALLLRLLLILSVYQINHNLHHNVLLLGAALSYHQREGYEGIVGYALVSVLGVKHAVVVEEPEEEHRSNALVAVAERVVLHHKIQKHCGFLLNRRIEFLATEGLINLSDAALERVVLLVSKPLAAAELLLQCVDSLHRIVVSGTERLVLGSLRDRERLIVVLVERVERIHIVGDNVE